MRPTTTERLRSPGDRQRRPFEVAVRGAESVELVEEQQVTVACGACGGQQWVATEVACGCRVERCAACQGTGRVTRTRITFDVETQKVIGWA